MRRAVIDVGSNSVLLLVAEKQGANWIPILETTAVTALGDGTKATGVLSETSMMRTLSALKSMFGASRSLGVAEITAAATMAARIAKNTPEFLSRAERQGTPVIVLPGNDEAELGFRSVANDPKFSAYDLITIIDPGGQSTELVTARRGEAAWRIDFRKSFPVGTLGLRSQMLGDESPDSQALLSATVAIDDLIGLCYLPGKVGHAVVLGATGTNLISIRERLTEWQPEKVHGAYLDFEEISKSVGAMMPMTDAERAAIPGMEKGREKTIHIGALILERFLNATGAGGCSVSVRGWRFALLEEGIEALRK